MVDLIIYECTDVLSHQPLTALVDAESGGQINISDSSCEGWLLSVSWLHAK